MKRVVLIPMKSWRKRKKLISCWRTRSQKVLSIKGEKKGKEKKKKKMVSEETKEENDDSYNQSLPKISKKEMQALI